MKTRTMVGAMLLTLALLVPLAVQAQMAGQQFLLHVDIPFPFIAGGMHLPAGHYHLYHPGDPNLLIIQEDDRQVGYTSSKGRDLAQAAIYTQVNETNFKSTSTKLVFNKYGDQYFLAQVWTEGDFEMHASLKCKAEQTLAAKYEKPGIRVILAKK